MLLSALVVGQKFQFLDGPSTVYTFNGTAFPSGFSFFASPDDVQTTRFDHPVLI